MYERLTGRTGNGQIYLVEGLEEDMYGYYTGKGLKQIEKVIDRLAAYEDTGLSLEQVKELAKAKADGRLVELPCKVGDEVWLQNIFTEDISKGVVRDLLCTSSRDAQWNLVNNGWTIKVESGALSHFFKFGDIGNTVFLTREAAEKPIAEVGE